MTIESNRDDHMRRARFELDLAYLAAGVAIGGGAWAVTRYGPEAFALRSAESYEHQGERGGVTEDAEDHGNEG